MILFSLVDVFFSFYPVEEEKKRDEINNQMRMSNTNVKRLLLYHYCQAPTLLNAILSEQNRGICLQIEERKNLL